MGEGLEFPTSVTTLHILKWDLLIILQSVCAGHLYFVYSYSHGALVTFFSHYYSYHISPFSRLQFMSLIIGL